MRSQFHHVIDIVPTILEVTGITEPAMVNGVAQTPIEGTSMAYSFPAESADAPTRRYTQYFEMFGNRGLYHDGWMASCRHGRLPWTLFGSADFAEDRWEPYHVAEDFSQAVSLRPSYFCGRDSVTFYEGMVRLPEGSAPKTHNLTHTIAVATEIPDGGAEGVLVCLGGDTAGWTLYIRDDGHLVYHYNWFDMERYDVVSDRPVGVLRGGPPVGARRLRPWGWCCCWPAPSVPTPSPPGSSGPSPPAASTLPWWPSKPAAPTTTPPWPRSSPSATG